MAAVVIIGGGISGLSTAWYLAKAGIPSTIIEARPRLGGVICTERVEGCVIEGGPDSFLSAKPAATDLIGELGLSGEIIGSNDHLRVTYIWKGGRLVPLPDGLMMMVPTRFMPLVTTRLLSLPTKIRMGLELFRKPPGNPRQDRSVAEFVREHYGAEAVDYLAEPLLSGIYGGSPEALSVESVLPRFAELDARYGSLTRGVLAERKAAHTSAGGVSLFRTLRGGLGTLISALQTRLQPQIRMIHGTAESIGRRDARLTVRVNKEWIEADHVVLACEAHRASNLSADLAPEISALLRTVSYSSSMTVALGFTRSDFPKPLNAFGFLVPRKERRHIVACTSVGVKFPDRVPDGMVLLRCFIGGTGEDPALHETDEAAVQTVLEDLHWILKFRAQPMFSRVFRWPRAMAQYNIGHRQRLVDLKRQLAAFPGLHVAGNAYEGIGIPDCIRTGKQAAEQIIGLLSASQA